MADAPWVAINIDYWRNPKVAEAGFLAASLNLAAIAYCAEQLTDGFVPTMVVPILAAPMHGYVWVGEEGVSPTPGDVADSRWANLAASLVIAGLWRDVPGGYEVVNYLDHQPSRVEVEARKERARENGRKGGTAKASNRLANPSANPVAKQPASDLPSDSASESVAPIPAPTPTELQPPNPSSSPLRGDAASEEFETFWAIYPRREGKKAAEKAFAKAARRVPATVIIGGAARFRSDPNLPTDRSFIPHPATWINQGRWEDDPLPARGLRIVPSRVQEQDDMLRGWHQQALSGQMPELGA